MKKYLIYFIKKLPPNNLIDPLIDIILFKEISVSDIDISKVIFFFIIKI